MADHKDTESAQSSGQEENFKARRRLLKASAAVPLIGTLSPGAALAASSSQCDMDGNNTFPDAVAAEDKALRVQAVYWESKNPAKRNDLYEVSGEFYDALDGQRVRPKFRSQSTRPKGYYRGVQRYVLCYVDVGRNPSTGEVTSQQVQITGFFPQRNTFGTAMTDSCWDSIGGQQSMIYDNANG